MTLSIICIFIAELSRRNRSFAEADAGVGNFG
jgi:hypothetical protein